MGVTTGGDVPLLLPWMATLSTSRLGVAIFSQSRRTAAAYLVSQRTARQARHRNRSDHLHPALSRRPTRPRSHHHRAPVHRPPRSHPGRDELSHSDDTGRTLSPWRASTFPRVRAANRRWCGRCGRDGRHGRPHDQNRLPAQQAPGDRAGGGAHAHRAAQRLRRVLDVPGAVGRRSGRSRGALSPPRGVPDVSRLFGSPAAGDRNMPSASRPTTATSTTSCSSACARTSPTTRSSTSPCAARCSSGSDAPSRCCKSPTTVRSTCREGASTTETRYDDRSSFEVRGSSKTPTFCAKRLARETRCRGGDATRTESRSQWRPATCRCTSPTGCTRRRAHEHRRSASHQRAARAGRRPSPPPRRPRRAPQEVGPVNRAQCAAASNAGGYTTVPRSSGRYARSGIIIAASGGAQSAGG